MSAIRTSSRPVTSHSRRRRRALGGLTALVVSWLSLLILVGGGFLVLQKVQSALVGDRLTFLAQVARIDLANGIDLPPEATAAALADPAADLAGRFRLPVLLAVFLPLGHATAALWFVLRLRRIRWSWPWQAANWTAFFGTALLLVGILASLHIDESRIRAELVGASLGQAPDGQTEARLRAAFAALAPALEATLIPESGLPQAAPDWKPDFRAVLDDGRSLVVAEKSETIFLTPAFLRSVKNLAVLTFAIALPVGLFRHIDGSPNRSWRYRPRRRHRSEEGDAEAALTMIRLVYFLAVLSENLVASFLPRLLKEVAATAALPPSFASALFMTYFFAFAFSLVPAGHWAGRSGPRPLIWVGCALSAVAMVLPALSLAVVPMMVSRLLAGLGQGVLMIGVQSYILEAAPAGRKTQGAGIIVYGFNAGMISGLAIGSLLLDHIGRSVLFAMAAALAFGTALLAWSLLPVLALPARPKRGKLLLWRKLHTGLARRKSEQMALGDLSPPDPDRVGLRSLLCLDFVKTTLLIGIPAKGVLTGVILFALPLLLARQDLGSEEIGQIIMFYAMGVLAANRIMSRLADRRSQTGAILFAGALLSGGGLTMIGLTGWAPAVAIIGQGASLTMVMVLSVLVIGIAHGFINAPVVTHIADLPASRRLGSARAAATYRFLERVGHVTGPMIIDRVMAFGGHGATSMIWVGGAITAFSLLFVLRKGESGLSSPHSPPALPEGSAGS